MEDTNLREILVQKGLSNERATDIANEIAGTDLISLVDSLSEIPDHDTSGTAEVLDSYGIIVDPNEFSVPKPKTESRKPIMRKKVNESIMGMSRVDPIGRMRKLAGLPPLNEEFEDVDDFADNEDQVEYEVYQPEESYQVTGSDAMSIIQDSINNISMNLPDLKLYEYKEVVEQLKNLLDSARDSGRTMLGESRFGRFRHR